MNRKNHKRKVNKGVSVDVSKHTVKMEHSILESLSYTPVFHICMFPSVFLLSGGKNEEAVFRKEYCGMLTKTLSSAGGNDE